MFKKRTLQRACMGGPNQGMSTRTSQATIHCLHLKILFQRYNKPYAFLGLSLYLLIYKLKTSK